MFDIGFFELVLVGLVGLLVLGPERLPGALRQGGLWLGRIKRQLKQIRQDVEREVGADEIRQQLHNEEIMRQLKASDEEIKAMQQRQSQGLSNHEKNHEQPHGSK